MLQIRENLTCNINATHNRFFKQDRRPRLLPARPPLRGAPDRAVVEVVRGQPGLPRNRHRGPEEGHERSHQRSGDHSAGR